MKDKIALIGHINCITLDAATILVDTHKETKTIHEIIEEERSIKFTKPPEIPLIAWNFKSGKESRRERRKKERQSNKNKKS
jgi:hypothetical protein